MLVRGDRQQWQLNHQQLSIFVSSANGQADRTCEPPCKGSQQMRCVALWSLEMVDNQDISSLFLVSILQRSP